MTCTGEPLVVLVQLAGKVLVSRLYLSPPYSSTILLGKKNRICSWYVQGTFSSAPRFIRYLFSDKITGNLSLTKSFFIFIYFVFAYLCDVALCLKIVRSGWRNIYVYSNLSSEMIILFLFFFFRDYQLKLKANTHYEKQEHNSLQQIYF